MSRLFLLISLSLLFNFSFTCTATETDINKVKDTLHIIELASVYSTPKEKVNFLNKITFQLSNSGLSYWSAYTALAISEEIDYKNGIADANKNIGNVYMMQKNYIAASKYYLKALDDYMILKDTVGMSRIYNNLGLACWQLDSKILAENYLLTAQELLRSTNETDFIHTINVNLSMCYLEQINSEGLNDTNRFKLDSAKAYVDAAYYLNDDQKQHIPMFLQCSTIYYKAYCYYLENDYLLSLHNLNKMDSLIKIYKHAEIIPLLDVSNLSRSKCYFNLNKMDSAEYFAEMAADSSKASENWNVVYLSYLMLAKIYKLNKNSTKEIQILDSAIELINRITIDQNKERMLFEMINNINDFEHIHIEKEKKAQASKYIGHIYAIIGLCAILIIALIVIYMHYKSKKQENEALTKTNTELTESKLSLKELNDTKNKFFSIIAHDLRNPINILLNSTNILASSSNVDAEVQLEIVDDINSTTKHLSNLLENLLSWARTQSNKIEVNFSTLYPLEIVNTCYFLLKLNADAKKIDIKIDVESNLLTYADLNLVTTVLRNLLSNAIKFTPHNGQVVIAAKEVKKQSLPEQFRENSNDKVILFSVKDNGLGMSDEVKNNLFKIEKNRSTSGTDGEKGTGLGLVICAEFVEINGGVIWVESGINKGSTFLFTCKTVDKFAISNELQ